MGFGRQAINGKIMLLGVDGMDPRLTKKFVAKGLMPNVEEYIKRGSSAQDLILLGGHPTVTPPMWTTLATGCYANVHGITGFSRTIPGHPERIGYNIDSRLCKAEQLWNVFAESGKKMLVWHWPGSSWPPSSDSENLFVVDGTSPGSVGMSTAQTEHEYLLSANVDIEEVTIRHHAASEANAACVITGLEMEEESSGGSLLDNVANIATGDGQEVLITSTDMMAGAATENTFDLVLSPLRDAKGWAEAPEDAKEFTLLLSDGKLRRPCLVLKGEDGAYSKVVIYASKKDVTPIAELTPGVMRRQIIDEAIIGEERTNVHRSMKVLELAPDGSKLSMYISAAMGLDVSAVFHPKRIFQEIVDNCGYPVPTSMMGCQNKTFITDCMLDMWYGTAEWQAEALHYMIENESIEVLFSHYHAIDIQDHMFIKHLSADRPDNRLEHEAYEKFMEDVYIQTDYYLGKFLHYLDEGWTIFIMSDHGQISTRYGQIEMADAAGVNIGLMKELGLTALKKDADGNEISEIDWENTIAIAPREEHIYLNLKGRDEHGIIDPADQYEVEEDIITRLYSYKHPETGHRVIALALRNRDAVLLGQGGPEAGDICYWLAEPYCFDHADSLSTALGDGDTSVSPIFIAAGVGIKEGFTTDRIIRQIDFAPTVAAIGGVRMPAQCEGAPAYQIFTEEF